MQKKISELAPGSTFFDYLDFISVLHLFRAFFAHFILAALLLVNYVLCSDEGEWEERGYEANGAKGVSFLISELTPLPPSPHAPFSPYLLSRGTVL